MTDGRARLRTLLLPKLRGRRISTARQVARLVFALLGLAIAAGIYGTAVWFLEVCLRVETVGPLLFLRLLDMVLLVLTSALVLSNLVTALSSLFLADDLELLLAAPVPPRTFFAARFLEQLVQSSWMVLAFGLPVLLAFGRVGGGGWSYLALVASLPALLVIPAALASVVILLLVSALPAARVRDLILAALFVAFIVVYVLVRMLEPERFIDPESFGSLTKLLAAFSAPSSVFLPSHWATRAVAGTFATVSAPAQPLMWLALWGSAIGVYALAALLFRTLYAQAFTRSQQGRKVARLSRLWARLRGASLPADGPIRSPQRVGASVDALRVIGRLLPAGAAREFLIKDLKILLRDASQWSQIVLLLALVFIYLYNFRYFKSIGDNGIIGPYALLMVGLAMCAFVTAAISVRFAFPLVSLEGRVLWLLYSAPLLPERFLRAKILSTLPALFVIAEGMSVASMLTLGANGDLVLLGAGVGGLIAVSVGALCTGIGAVLPDYRAESAAKMAASFGGLICMTVSMIVSFLLIATAAYPAWLLYRRTPGQPLLLVGCAVAAIGITIAAVVISLALGARALRRHEP